MKKIKIFFQNVLEKLKKFLHIAGVFVKEHKVLSIMVVSLLVALILIFFLIIKPKWDYSHKKLDNGYTQSEIDEIYEWWKDYDGIKQEGTIPTE